MQKTVRYQMVAIVVSLTLLLQVFAPAAMFVRDGSAVEAALTQVAAASAVEQPLTVARVQSSYQAGDEITITYVIHNNTYAIISEPVTCPSFFQCPGNQCRFGA